MHHDHLRRGGLVLHNYPAGAELMRGAVFGRDAGAGVTVEARASR